MNFCTWPTCGEQQDDGAYCFFHARQISDGKCPPNDDVLVSAQKVVEAAKKLTRAQFEYDEACDTLQRVVEEKQ